MSSAAQVAANILNAQASTGPKTDDGKQRSSHNSLKHGLTASTILIPTEDPAAYDTFKQGLLGYWQPEGAGETAHVEEMINVQWRLRRCERLEAGILAVDMPDFKALNNVSLHASRLKRQYSVTFAELCELRNSRFSDRRENLRQAEIIRRADVIAKRVTNLAENGFDFTVEEIDRLIRRKDSVAAADRTVSGNLFRPSVLK